MNVSSATLSPVTASWPGTGTSSPRAGERAETPSTTPGAQGDGNAKSSTPGQLDARQQARVNELAKRDREVRAHEAAHVAAGGAYARGGATFQYTKGPDGRLYATSGEVSIDVSSVPNDPQATIRKMEVVQRAALAPADPSAQDRSVAAAAAQEEGRARMELVQSRAAGYQNSSAGTHATGSRVDTYA
jgi:hypothetical protein